MACCEFHNENCVDLEEACCMACPTWTTPSNVPHVNASFCVCDRCRPDLAADDARREAGQVTETTAPSRCPTCDSIHPAIFAHPCMKSDYIANDWHAAPSRAPSEES